jgi:hypothetical protein
VLLHRVTRSTYLSTAMNYLAPFPDPSDLDPMGLHKRKTMQYQKTSISNYSNWDSNARCGFLRTSLHHRETELRETSQIRQCVLEELLRGAFDNNRARLR